MPTALEITMASSRDADAAGDGKGGQQALPLITQMNRPMVPKEAAPEEKAVGKTDPHLLHNKTELLAGGQVLVHQHPDGNGQGLGAHVARHVQDQGLEAHDQRELGHHLFKDAHYGGHHQPQSQQDEQPGEALFMLCPRGSARSSSAVRPASMA